MKKMTNMILLSAAALAVGPARAFDGTPAPTAADLLATAQADLATKQTEFDNATSADASAKSAVTAAETAHKSAEGDAKVAAAATLATAKEQAKVAAATLKAAKSAHGAATKAIGKAQTAATKEAKKIADAAAAEAAKQAAEEAKKAQQMPEQNGVRRPKPDGACGKAWKVFDDISLKNGSPASISEALPVAEAAGVNGATTRTQYARWRKFHSLSGRIEAPKAPEAPAPVTPPAAPVVPPVETPPAS